VIDFEDDGPQYPETADDEAVQAAFARWEGEHRVRVESAAGQAVRVPAVMFESSDHFLVLPAECRTLAVAARAATVEDARRAIEADADELEALRAESDPPDVDGAAANLLAHVRRVGDYLERAAEFGGCRCD
jgi:hypothetical protein